MAAMMTAALGLGPGLWRASYGPWRPEELMALERTLLILAQEINTASGTDDSALRLVMDALVAADGIRGGPARCTGVIRKKALQ